MITVAQAQVSLQAKALLTDVEADTLMTIEGRHHHDQLTPP